MATVANRESTAAIAKVLGGCAAVGTFFSILDTIRNHTAHNFTSVCIFGVASLTLFKVGSLIERLSFPNRPQVPAESAVLGRAYGTPNWLRPSLWITLFLIMLALWVELYLHREPLHLTGTALTPAFMAIFAAYLFGCQRAERWARVYLRRWAPDRAQVAIGADGLWVTGTEIPWTAVRGIDQRTRYFKPVDVQTIVVHAQSPRRMEAIEIDLSDSVENAQELYAKLRSAAAAHGVSLEGDAYSCSAARQHEADRQTVLPDEIAKTEARLQEVNLRIEEAEARILDLKRSAIAPEQSQRHATLLEQAQANLNANIALRDSFKKLLAIQKEQLRP